MTVTFRRIPCNILAVMSNSDLSPNDIPLLGRIVENISYNNANNYFGIEL